MAMALLRSGFQSAVRKGVRRSPPNSKNFSSAAHHDDEYEMVKWERITYLGIATCSVLAIYNLSKGHRHYEEPPPYPYLRIRNKDFPWGPDGLLEKKKKDH